LGCWRLRGDLGYYSYHRRDWQKAEEHFRRAIAQSPEHERAYVNLGLALGEQERFQESFDAFAKVLGPAAASRWRTPMRSVLNMATAPMCCFATGA